MGDSEEQKHFKVLPQNNKTTTKKKKKKHGRNKHSVKYFTISHLFSIISFFLSINQS